MRENMFKRNERKLKAVFRMQFQATQVPQVKSKGLMIYLIPVDVGKPTVKVERTPIIEGTCTWENPVYETVKLIQEIKTGKIREKFYYLVVSTGASKSGFLGEVSIDFADLTEAVKPLKLTLPLQTSKSGAVLHVTVQRMQGENDLRFYEEDELPEAESYDEAMDTECHGQGNRKLQYHETDFCEAKCNGKMESSMDYVLDKADMKSRDSTKNASQEMMTNQVKMLERKAEVSEMELQSLRQQIIKEGKKGQQLSQKIINLREERDALKFECEQLKSLSKYKNGEEVSSPLHKETECARSTQESIKQELQREKQLNKRLKFQLQKTEDSNSEFVLAVRDLNKKMELKNTEIAQLSSKIKALRSEPEVFAAVPRKKMDDECKTPRNKGNDDETEILRQNIDKLEQKLEVQRREKENILIDLKKLTLDYEKLEKQNKEIDSTLQQIQKEKMEMHHDYIESLNMEKKLKLQIETLEEKIKSQALQYSESLMVIDEFEIQEENMKKEMENQAQLFEEELNAVSEVKIEHEQRAIRAEEAFRKARRYNADAIERLQEEIEQLSADLSSKIEENEKILQKSMVEVNDLREKNDVLEDVLQKAEEEHKIKQEEYEKILHELQKQNKLCTDEKEDLQNQLASVRDEAEELTKDNVNLKSQVDQKKPKEENLHLEVKKLRQKNSDLKNNLSQVELERNNLKKELVKSKDNLRKNKELEETAMKNIRKVPAKDNSTEEAEKITEKEHVQSVRKNRFKQDNVSEEKRSWGKNTNNGNSNNKDNLSEQHIHDAAQIKSLLSEVELLKEKNRSMEETMTELHEKYSETSLRFAEVESERQQLVMTLRNMRNGKKS